MGIKSVNNNDQVTVLHILFRAALYLTTSYKLRENSSQYIS